MKKHFVTFFSPGTFVAENTIKSIDSWDVTKAVEMARNIKERHGATPYGFQFSTRERKDDELDSRVIERSGIYYLGGRVLTICQLEEMNDPRNDILISNMKFNGWEKVIQNDNSWRWTQCLQEGDIVLEWNSTHSVRRE
jgi:hypothetical protein